MLYPDASNVDPLSEIEQFLAASNRPYADLDRYGVKMLNGDFSAAQNLIQEMADQPDLAGFAAAASYFIELDQNANGLYALAKEPDAEKALLGVAQDKSQLGSANAQAALEFFSDESFLEEVILPKVGSGGKDKDEKGSKKLSVNNSWKTDAQIDAFPNPSNGRTNFRYRLPQQQDAQLIILDINGRRLKSIPLPTEVREMSIDLTSLPDGIYFYGLQVNGQNQSMKKIIIQH
ncbi:MAG: T9SS type A sorting domain-containing protein [Bacteroidota bacterium]